MTKEILKLLEQYESIKAEKDELQNELDRQRREVTDTVSGSSPNWPYCKHPVSIKGTPPLSPALVDKLDAMVAQLTRQRAEIETFLSGVQSSQTRRIIRLKYIEGRTWQQVAFAIGHHDEQYPRRKIERFLECTKCTK